MRNFGVFIFSGMGGLGMAMSAALLRRLFSGGTGKVRKLVVEDETTVFDNGHETAEDEKDVVSRMGESSAFLPDEKAPGVGRGFDVYSVETTVCSFSGNITKRIEDTSAHSPREASVLPPKEPEAANRALACESCISDILEQGLSSEDGLSSGETILHVEEYVLESPQLSPTNSFCKSSKTNVFHHAPLFENNRCGSGKGSSPLFEECSRMPDVQASDMSVQSGANRIVIHHDQMPFCTGVAAIRDEYDGDDTSISSRSGSTSDAESRVQCQSETPSILVSAIQESAIEDARTTPSVEILNSREDTSIVAGTSPPRQLDETVKPVLMEISAIPLNNSQAVNDPLIHDTLHATEIDVFAQSRLNRNSRLDVEAQKSPPATANGGKTAKCTEAQPPSPPAEHEHPQIAVFYNPKDHSKENEMPAPPVRSVSQKIRRRVFRSKQSSRGDDRRRSMRLKFTPLRRIKRSNK